MTFNGVMVTENETQTCAQCATPVHPLDVFPNAKGAGILCLSCYADSPEGRYVPTADELTVMWGGKVRKGARR